MGSGASSALKVLIGDWEFRSSNELPDRGGDVSLYAEGPYKPPWRATIRALPKNMRKIERRLSLPNRSNGTRKGAGKLTISRGADGAEAGVGKMIGGDLSRRVGRLQSESSAVYMKLAREGCNGNASF